MPQRCRFSGLQLPASPDFPSIQLKWDAHLIFRAPFRILVDEIENRKTLTPRQQRLLFLALLKETDLCIFESPALPSDRIIETNFAKLLDVCYFIFQHRTLYDSFPRYRIDNGTCNLANIGTILDTWLSVRDTNQSKWDKKGLDLIMADQALEQKITKAILSKKDLTPNFNKTLIRWALETAEAPKGKYVKWSRIFLASHSRKCPLCKGDGMFIFFHINNKESCPTCEGTGKISDIEKLSFDGVMELRNFMVLHLPEETSYESTRKRAVLHHLSKKLKAIQQLRNAFGLNIYDSPEDAERAMRDKRNSPTAIPEPKPEQFQRRIDYLRELAKYRAQETAEDSETEEESDVEELEPEILVDDSEELESEESPVTPRAISSDEF